MANKILLIFIGQLFVLTVKAQVVITGLGSTYTQDFNTLASSGTSSTLPTGWALFESGFNQNTTYNCDNGALTAGNTYSYGSTSSAERAFGGLQSGSLIPTSGVQFLNNSGSVITSITINYTGEQWRLGNLNRTDRLDFQYSTNATSLNTGTWTDENSLDFTAPVTTGTIGALDGNNVANRTLIGTFTLTGLTIPVGSSFWFRWNDLNATGADDGLGIDDISVSFNGNVSPPCTEPINQPTGLSLSAAAATAAAINVNGTFSAAPGSDAYLVVRSTSSTLSANPADGTTYSPGQALGGGFVVSIANQPFFNDNGIASGTRYYYFIFSYNRFCTGGPDYFTINPLKGNTLLSVVSGNQSGTWAKALSPYYFFDNVTVPTALTLSIEPGVSVNMSTKSFQVDGTLIANGAGNDSIRLFGKGTASVSHGGWILFNTGSVNSSLSYASIDSLGETSLAGYAIKAIGQVVIANSLIRNSEGNSIQFAGSNCSVLNCSFSRQYTNGYTAIYLASDTIVPTIQNCSFTGSAEGKTILAYAGNVTNFINNADVTIQVSGSIVKNTIFHNPGSNSIYQLTGSITVNQGVTLTIEPGSTIDAGTIAGFITINGRLVAQGNETGPIQFVRLSGGTGLNSVSIIINSTSTGSVFNYVYIDRLGNITRNAALEIATPNISFANTSISNSYQNGLYLSGTGALVFANCNFNNNYDGVIVTSGRSVFSNCNFTGNSSYGIYNTSSAIADTVDARNCWWGNSSGPLNAAINPLGLGDRVSDKVLFIPWKTQPANGQVSDIGIGTLFSPFTNCGLTAAETVKVRVNNYGNTSQTGITVSYKLNNNAPVTESIGPVSLLPGSFIDYEFSTRANLGNPGAYTFTCYTGLVSDSLHGNDTLVTTVQHLNGLASPASLFPADSTLNLNIPVNLSWGSVTNAGSYDIYVWKSIDTMPAVPTVAGIIPVNYNFSNLSYGTLYKWKVAARNNSCQTFSPTRQFRTRYLPDLVTDSISVPPTATSQSSITINWRIKNKGEGSTQNYAWQDNVYLSEAQQLGIVPDYFLGSTHNVTALDSSQSYTSGNLVYTLPQGLQGNYYVFVKTNAYNSLLEKTDTNNTRRSAAIAVSLLPPPDLQVDSVVVNPTTAFSEDSITVKWKVFNSGPGLPTDTAWQDGIYLSTSDIFSVNTAIKIGALAHTGSLAPGMSYSRTHRVKLPAQINGTYYIHVFTDMENQVYEYVNESNNSNKSLPVTIILRPTPNLLVSGIAQNQDTLSIKQPVTLQWNDVNSGAAKAVPTWKDGIYISTDTLFSIGAAIRIDDILQTDTVQLASLKPMQKTTSIPDNLAEGNYYFFVKADYTNSLFEGNNEADNVSVYQGPVYVVKPDLKPVSLTFPFTAFSGNGIDINWKVRNFGKGGIFNGTWKDKIYISSDTLFNPLTDTLLYTATYSNYLNGGGEYQGQQTISLPANIQGVYNVFLVTDAAGSLPENDETNNIFRPAGTITITLSPWPDLKINNITVPDTDTMGTTLNFTYAVINSGPGNLAGLSVTDSIYLSPAASYNDPGKVWLANIVQERSIDSGQAYTQAVAATLPSNLPGGQYYILVVTDAGKQVFENSGESNNRDTSSAIQLAPLQQVDLAVISGQTGSGNVQAGQQVAVQWTVKNNPPNATVVSNWADAIYLSANTTLDASDRLLASFPVSELLQPGATYSMNGFVTIPNNVSGTYYLLAVADKNSVHNDLNRINNSLAVANGAGGQAIVITQPTPSDLIPLTFNPPAAGTEGQPITLSYAVKNNGAGVTQGNTWLDAFYLSGDMQLSADDINIGNSIRDSSLAAGASYNRTVQVFLPAGLSGNYFIIFKTDASGSIYEYNGEQNNTASLPFIINLQQPCDLVPFNVKSQKDTLIAGNADTIQWKLANRGVNPAIGYIKEAVYFSADSILDINDVLLGTRDGNVSIIPGDTLDRQLLVTAGNLANNSYYVIVRTDILNNLLESNEANNTASSSGQVKLTVKPLLMNVLTADTVLNNIPDYFKIDIQPSGVNETMQLTLKGDSAGNSVNRIFIKSENIPDVNNYDFSAQEPFAANQQLLVPRLNAGSYYILVTGNKPGGIPQAVTLKAEIIPFRITSVMASKGGNTGYVTLRIRGSKFEHSTSFRLRNDSLNTTLYASAVYFVNSTDVFATFNPGSSGRGLYDVVAVRSGNDTAKLLKGFEIINGPGNGPGSGPGNSAGAGFVCQISNIGFEELLRVDAIHPASTRRNLVVGITIYYENTGTVDIPVPVKYLVSLDGAPIAFTVADLTRNNTELMLECKEQNGPPGILRPGASGFIKVYARATRQLQFVIVE